MSDPKSGSEGGEKWYERTLYQVLLFAGGIALFGLVLGFVLDWYIDPQTSTQKKDLVQALGLITAGVAGAVGIFFTWRGQRLAREAQEANQRNTQDQLTLSRRSQEENQRSTRAQLETAQEELRLTRQGQMTERFAQAIEQLGSESLEIRLGGIYSLERTAQEERNYHWPIMEVLTSYVRRHAPRAPRTESDENPAAPPKPDIQAILDVIGRRSEHHRTDETVESGTIDLKETDLRLVQLLEAHLEGANLRGANLWGAHLRGAHLDGADLWAVHLGGAYLEGANLVEANLVEANLGVASLPEANLEGANLWGADLEGVFLTRANLGGANLPGAHLEGARLFEAHLGGANLRGASLVEANFEGAILEGAILEGAILEGAENLTRDQLEVTLGDENTRLPAGLEPPAHWGVKTDEQTEGG